MATLKGKADVSFSLDGKEWTKLETLNEVMMGGISVERVISYEVRYVLKNGETYTFTRDSLARVANALADVMIQEKYGSCRLLLGQSLRCYVDYDRTLKKPDRYFYNLFVRLAGYIEYLLSEGCNES